MADPAMVSAVAKAEVYQLAREGIETQREPRLVNIYELTVQAWPENEFMTAGDRVSVLVECSSGTYIRQLAADLGERLGCGAHIGSLSRTKVGDFDISACYTLEEVEQAVSDGSLLDKVLPIARGLSHLPTVTLTEADRDVEKRMSVGAFVQARDMLRGLKHQKAERLKEGDFISVIGSSGDVLCVSRLETTQGEPYLHPFVVFSQGRY